MAITYRLQIKVLYIVCFCTKQFTNHSNETTCFHQSFLNSDSDYANLLKQGKVLLVTATLATAFSCNV